MKKGTKKKGKQAGRRHRHFCLGETSDRRLDRLVRKTELSAHDVVRQALIHFEAHVK